mgnify:CR=1 FL=1
MIRRPQRSTQRRSSAASDVYKGKTPFVVRDTVVQIGSIRDHFSHLTALSTTGWCTRIGIEEISLDIQTTVLDIKTRIIRSIPTIAVHQSDLSTAVIGLNKDHPVIAHRSISLVVTDSKRDLCSAVSSHISAPRDATISSRTAR